MDRKPQITILFELRTNTKYIAIRGEGVILQNIH